MELKNSGVLITGGTNGIGLELIKQLIRKGTNITVTGPSLAALEETKSSSPKGGTTSWPNRLLEPVYLIEWTRRRTAR